MDDPTEMECCEKRIGILPETGAPVTYHTADCPRLDDRVMHAFLTDQWQPTDATARDTQRLRDALWQLRCSWLARSQAMHSDGFPDQCATALDSAARELRAVLEASSG